MFESRFNRLQIQAGIEVAPLFKSFLNKKFQFLKQEKQKIEEVEPKTAQKVPVHAADVNA
jgi:hypothetical protein